MIVGEPRPYHPALSVSHYIHHHLDPPASPASSASTLRHLDNHDHCRLLILHNRIAGHPHSKKTACTKVQYCNVFLSTSKDTQSSSPPTGVCSPTPTMASRDVALDEMQWKSSAIAQAMQGVHENSVLHYFANSPFFDPTSNNAILVSQASYNPKMFEVLQTRAAFEARLRTMAGLEFLIAEQPAEMAPGTGTGVWVIRKQTRRKRPGEEDEIAVHATFFVVGENIYTAPTVAEVVGNRLVCVNAPSRRITANTGS